MNWNRDEFSVSCDPAKLDSVLIAGFLASSYWANGISKETVEKSLEYSICFSLLHGNRQIGFGRVISDRATIGMIGVSE